MTTAPTIAPLKGIHYQPEKVGDFSKVVAPPYDVISKEQQKGLYELSPYNIVRIDLSQETPGDNETNNRYTRAAATFHEWLEQSVLVQEDKPAIYLYEQEFTVPGKGTFQRRGFYALRRLEEFSEGRILPHEKTLSGPKADRFNLMKATQANLSAIFGLYQDKNKKVREALSSSFEKKPFTDFVDSAKIRHRLWIETDATLHQLIDNEMKDSKIFIADGHHRYETGLNYRKERLANDQGNDQSPYNYILMFFCEMEDPGLLILPTHRRLKNWPSFEKESFLQKAGNYFNLEKIPVSELSLEALDKKFQKPYLAVVFPGDDQGTLLTLNHQKVAQSKNLSQLSAALLDVDTALLHEGLLKEILGLTEAQEKDTQVLEYIKDAREALESRNREDTKAVFLMSGTTMPVLQAVAKEGKVLPPKTTYFYPKILTGLVINSFEH